MSLIAQKKRPNFWQVSKAKINYLFLMVQDFFNAALQPHFFAKKDDIG
jgi:hypothetical protein